MKKLPPFLLSSTFLFLLLPASSGCHRQSRPIQETDYFSIDDNINQPTPPKHRHLAVGRPRPVLVEAPLPVPLEEKTQALAPYPGWLWIDGYWHWQSAYWLWIPGEWVPPRGSHVYVEPTYIEQNNNMIYTSGYWDYPYNLLNNANYVLVYDGIAHPRPKRFRHRHMRSRPKPFTNTPHNQRTQRPPRNEKPNRNPQIESARHLKQGPRPYLFSAQPPRKTNKPRRPPIRIDSNRPNSTQSPIVTTSVTTAKRPHLLPGTKLPGRRTFKAHGPTQHISVVPNTRNLKSQRAPQKNNRIRPFQAVQQTSKAQSYRPNSNRSQYRPTPSRQPNQRQRQTIQIRKNPIRTLSRSQTRPIKKTKQLPPKKTSAKTPTMKINRSAPRSWRKQSYEQKK